MLAVTDSGLESEQTTTKNLHSMTMYRLSPEVTILKKKIYEQVNIWKKHMIFYKYTCTGKPFASAIIYNIVAKKILFFNDIK